MGINPIRDNDRDKTSVSGIVASPIGGLNTKDSYATMPPTDAIAMENFIPRENGIELRKGYTKLAIEENPPITIPTNFNSQPIMMSAYNALDENFKRLIVQFNGITARRREIAGIDTTVSPANCFQFYSVNQATAFFFARFCAIQFKNCHILCKAYSDQWNDTSTHLSNLNSLIINNNRYPANIYIGSTIIYYTLPTVYKNRLFFASKEDLTIYFGGLHEVFTPTEGIQVKPLDISEECPLSRRIATMFTWTRTAIEGIDEMLVIITDEGELVAYSGFKPDDDLQWGVVARYTVPKLLGAPFCWERVGNDIVLLTVEGIISLSRLLKSGFVGDENETVSAKINSTIKKLAHIKFMWWGIKLLPSLGLLIINAPDEYATAGKSEQYVYNMATGAWCKFTGINATEFVEFRDEVFFGKLDGDIDKDIGIQKFWVSTSDNGKQIKAYTQQAYSNFDTPRLKVFKSVNIIYSSDEDVKINTSFSTDFVLNNQVYTASQQSQSIFWNQEYWDTVFWSPEKITKVLPVSLAAYPGYYGSLSLNIETSTTDFNWYATMVNTTLAN